ADHTVIFWPLAGTGAQIIRPSPAPVRALAFRPGEQSLAVGDATGRVDLWTPATGSTCVLGSHPGGITALAFGSDGPWLYSCGEDRMVRVWDAATGALRNSIGPTQEAPTALAVSPTGEWLAVGDAHAVALHDARTCKFDRLLPCPDGEVACLAFSPD